ncbi:MAG: 6-phosphogluconolactonase, partial [Chitinophagaceae bacterium]
MITPKTHDLTDSFEKMPVFIHNSIQEGSVFVAKEIASLIRDKQSRDQYCVLGLATGSTPKTLYAELVRMHREENLSFKNVVSFNLDEYYPIENDALQSYNRFMRTNLFDHVDIDPKNIHIPDGQVRKELVKQYCL